MSLVLRVIQNAFKTRIEHGTFEKVLDKIKILSAGSGELTAKMAVDKVHCNTSNTLHGGLAATMVDSLTTLALLSLEVKDEKSKLPQTVSIELNMTYLRPVPVGSEILIKCSTDKRGKNIAFLTMNIFNQSDQKLVAKGNHLKAIINT